VSTPAFSRLVDAVQWAVAVVAGAALVMLFTLEGAPADGDGEATTEDPPAAVTSDEDVVALGRAVYAEHCASCHGAAGGGGLGPPLGGVVDTYPDPADQVTFVAAGRGLMQGFDDVLSTEELEAVVAFTREGLG
jgi:mono/diheme cytochrome c family protein